MKSRYLMLLIVPLCMFTQYARADFRDNNNGTVTDLKSNLMWQKCSAPSAAVTCGGVTPATYSWDNALAYCNALSFAGHADWRLPNVKELHSILDAGKNASPTINTGYFTDAQAAYYWSATTFVDTPSMAWYVDFSIGLVMTSPLDKLELNYVRCVR
ncbi:MAG: DUF1566 domain-containing protein [Gammaproteobacteria bacterium]|nr:DUF1566 domain-containing protein [Gammaproteobacteria bacterium]